MEGLFRRGGVWWARLVVPERLRAGAGRREFVRSTRCRELGPAKLAHALLMAGWRRSLLDLDRGCTVNDDELRRLLGGSPALVAGDFMSLRRAVELTGIQEEDLLREAEAGRLALYCRVPPEAPHGWAAGRAALERFGSDEWTVPSAPPLGAVDLAMGGRTLRLLDGGADVAGAALAGRQALDLVVLEDGAGGIWVPDKMVTVSAAALEVQGREVEAVRQRWAESVPPERLVALSRTERALSASEPAVEGVGGPWAAKPISWALNEYLTDPAGLQGQTDQGKEIAQRDRLLRRFVDHCGDGPLGRFTDDDIRSFRDWAKTWPAGNLKKSMLRPSWAETVKAASEVGWPVMTAQAVAERVIWVRQFFKWLHRKGRLNVDIGGALAGETGLTKAERKEVARAGAIAAREAGARPGELGKGRRAFTHAELSQVFGRAQFLSGDGRHAAGNARCDPHEYWAPVLALLHGLRANEACQLSLDDICEVDGVPCLDINGRAPDRSVKNTKKGSEVQMVERVVPVHPLAIRLGLLRYRDALRTAGYRRLFPELRYHGEERYYGEPGRKFTEAKKALGLGSKVTFYSFRHTFNNALARVGPAALPKLDEKMRAFLRYQITGHETGQALDVNQGSYSEVTMRERAAMVSAVEFEGLPQLAPFDVAWGVEAVARVLAGRKKPEHNGPAD